MAAAVGDIAGSAYEGRTHRTKDYNAVKMFSSRAHFTDDTVLTFACAEAFLKNKKPLSLNFGQSFFSLKRVTSVGYSK